MGSEYVFFQVPWGGSSVKSTVQIELKTLKEKKQLCSVLLPTSEQSPPPVQLTSLGPHQARFFHQSRPPWPSHTGSSRLAITSATHPLSSLPF